VPEQDLIAKMLPKSSRFSDAVFLHIVEDIGGDEKK